jgi:hypothetical protein
MSDAGMMGDSSFEKRLRDNVQRLEGEIKSLERLLAAQIQRAVAETAHVKEKLASDIDHVQDLAEQSRIAAKEANAKTDSANDTHFKNVNEFNARMEKVVTEQASKEWADGFEKTVAALNDARQSEIRAGDAALSARVTILENRNIQVAGKEEGIKLSASTLYAALAVAVLLIAIITFASKLMH